MKEFVTAVEDVVAADEREEKIRALMAEGKTREDAEAEVDGDKPVEFKMDGRVLKAYPLTDGQLAFMLANLGRGQTADQRFAGILNIMLASLKGDDKDYVENRLLLPKGDPKRLGIKELEAVFEYLMEEWFGNPTQE